MAQRKGQTGNPSGRPKGSKNKATVDIKKWISGIIDQNEQQLEKDMRELKPIERWTITERLLQYITPKQQATTIEATIEAEYKELEKLLSSAPDKVIEKLTDKLIKLNQLNKKSDE